MSSGVAASSECLEAFSKLKMDKKTKYIIFALSDDKKEIVVDEQSDNPEYSHFLSRLPLNLCKWAVYDFDYTLEDKSQRSKICFFSWSPDNAPIRSKMVHSSSKDALRKVLDGIKVEIQGTDMVEVAYDTVLEKVKRISQ